MTTPTLDTTTLAGTRQDKGYGEQVGRIVGRYKLLQKIGEGGFGVVWMAEQAEPVVRRVALKVIKAGMNTKEIIARFESERQALALMDHPNIAKVFDAGATESGPSSWVDSDIRLHVWSAPSWEEIAETDRRQRRSDANQ